MYTVHINFSMTLTVSQDSAQRYVVCHGDSHFNSILSSQADRPTPLLSGKPRAKKGYPVNSSLCQLVLVFSDQLVLTFGQFIPALNFFYPSLT